MEAFNPSQLEPGIYIDNNRHPINMDDYMEEEIARMMVNSFSIRTVDYLTIDQIIERFGYLLTDEQIKNFRRDNTV